MHRDPFFNQTVPAQLRNLEENMQPRWGSMSVTEMLNHLAAGFRLSVEHVEGEITTPEEKLPAYRKFLMSDKPFAPNLKAPEVYRNYQIESKGDLQSVKVEFLRAFVDMLAYFDKHPEHTAVHHNFGRLGVQEWLQLHRKHIRHHFSQFGLDL